MRDRVLKAQTSPYEEDHIPDPDRDRDEYLDREQEWLEAEMDRQQGYEF